MRGKEIRKSVTLMQQLTEYRMILSGRKASWCKLLGDGCGKSGYIQKFCKKQTHTHARKHAHTHIHTHTKPAQGGARP